MSEKKKINIGLDIGVASVGWSILDDKSNIIKMGVRLFDDVADKKDGSLKNAKRRSMRSSRRRIRREANRKREFIKLLLKYNFYSSENEVKKIIDKYDITKYGVDNPIQLKVKALKEKVSNNELIIILFHYLHHRGFFYLTDEDIKNPELLEQKNHINPSEEIYKFYLENKYYKNSEITKKFSAKQYENEIKNIFNQQKLNNDDFEKEYINLFKTTRDFSEGPGSKKSPTPYGRWCINEKNELICRGENLWESLIGKCTYYSNEKRGGKKSPIAELFNLMNDINNINFFNNKYKLDKEIKEKIWEEYNKNLNLQKIKKYSLSPKELIKLGNKFNWFENKFGVAINEDDIDGYRISKDKQIITELDSYISILKWMIENNKVNKPINILDMDLLKNINDIFNKLSKHQDIQKRLLELEKENGSNESNLNLIKKIKGLSQTHNLSYKAMNEYIEFAKDNLDSNDNQMTFFENKINKDKKLNNTINSKYISKEFDADAIISPTAKRAFNQTINVLNKILKTLDSNTEISNITIEMARDKNSKEEAANITKFQNENAKKIDLILKNNSIQEKSENLSSIQYLRLKLWEEQSHKDVYDGQLIDISDVISGYGLNIDHIIPYSISNDDSFNNKVLTKSHLNAEKGNLSPYEWLSTKGTFDKFIENVQINVKNNKKIKLLLTKESTIDMAKEFIGRNLSDTRYASKLILNKLQNHFNGQNIYHPNTKIKVIRGSITNFARYHLLQKDNKILLHKNRDIYCHHAIDATIIAWLGQNKNIQNSLNYAQSSLKNNDYIIDRENKLIIDNETGEIIDLFKNYGRNEDTTKFAEELAKYNITFDKESNELKYGELSHNIKYSRMYKTQKNLPLSNETIYSIKWNDPNNKTIGISFSKIDLLKSSTSDLEEYFSNSLFSEKSRQKLLCYKSDSKLFNNLVTIFNQYYDKKINPFINYMKHEKGIENPIFIEIENKRIKKLKLIDSEKSINNIINLKSHNDNAFLEYLNAKEMRIYKNVKDKYIVIPINQKVLQFDKKTNTLSISNEKLKSVLDSNNIVNDKYILVNNGTIFAKKNTNELFYSNGGGVASKNLLELKCLYAKNNLVIFKERYQVSLSTIIKEYDIVEMDELGNIYSRREIML